MIVLWDQLALLMYCRSYIYIWSNSFTCLWSITSRPCYSCWCQASRIRNSWQADWYPGQLFPCWCTKYYSLSVWWWVQVIAWFRVANTRMRRVSHSWYVICTQLELDDTENLFSAIDPDKLPARANMDVMKQVELDNPQIFTKSIAYDGRKIAYSAVDLPLGGLSRTVRIHAECACIRCWFVWS